MYTRTKPWMLPQYRISEYFKGRPCARLATNVTDRRYVFKMDDGTLINL